MGVGVMGGGCNGSGRYENKPILSIQMETSCGNPYTNHIFQDAVERSDFAVVKTLLRYGVYLRRNQVCSIVISIKILLNSYYR